MVESSEHQILLEQTLPTMAKAVVNAANRMGMHWLQIMTLRVLVTLTLSGWMVTAVVAQVATPKAKGFFVFGDSYADTGNSLSRGACGAPPYGMSWPGRPTGRCGDGRIQTDYLADLIGLPSPTPYDFVGGNQSIASGINFAIAGSGITYALGVKPLGSEIDQLELLVSAGVYTRELFSESIAFISIAGNDYNGNFNTSEMFTMVEFIIEGLAQSIKRLYDLGFRNMMVANLAPINCLPAQTISTNYTSCPTATNTAIAYHNQLLQQAVAKLNMLPLSNVIILDEYKTFSHILNNSLQFGITERLVPCCRSNTPSSSCGQRDLNGDSLYIVCNDPSAHMYWDAVHPVQRSWTDVVGLFANVTGHVIGAPTLNVWLQQIAGKSVPPASAPFVASGANGQLERTYNALITRTKYTESVGLLQDLNLEDLLSDVPEQVVTIFLPENMAYSLYPQVFLDHIYGRDQVHSVIANHAVRGFFDLATLLTSPMMNLTTVNNLTISIDPTPKAIHVGTNLTRVVNPNLYLDPGFLVVHGIDHILFPSNLVYS